MLTTNKIISQLMQENLAVEDLHQKILQYTLFFIFLSVLNS